MACSAPSPGCRPHPELTVQRPRHLDRGARGRGRRQPRGAFAESEAILIATRVMEGCGSLAAALAVPRLLRAVTAPKHLAQVLALFAAHLPFGSVVMMLAGPHVITFGWQALWLINGAVALAYAAVIAACGSTKRRPRCRATVGADQYRHRVRRAGSGAAGVGVRHLHLSIPGAGGLAPGFAGRPDGAVDRRGRNGQRDRGRRQCRRQHVGRRALATGRAGLEHSGRRFAFVGLAAVGIFSDAAPVAMVAALAAPSLGLTGLIPGSIYAAAPRLAPTSAMLAIALGLINQVTNLGNLAARRRWRSPCSRSAGAARRCCSPASR